MDDLIEIIIIACLLMVIFLLAVDKVKIVKYDKQQTSGKEITEIIDIMGKPNIICDRTYDESEDVQGKMVESTHLDDLHITVQAIEDQSRVIDSIDEDWGDEPLPYDDRFSKAISMEEMLNVGKLLQQSDLQPEQENTVIDVMQKIHGTELYGFLENSIEHVSERIAKHLDHNFKIHESTVDGPLNNFDDFDINDFI